MYYSRYFLPTLKETPSEAEINSHRLMLRAGMIRKLTAGIYSYLPFGLTALRKVENIVREEMNRAGAQEVLLPTDMGKNCCDLKTAMNVFIVWDPLMKK